MTVKETTICVPDTPDPKREEEAVVRDAEVTKAGEMAEAEERAQAVADGVDLPISPDDVESEDSGRDLRAREMDFDDPDEDEEDHGRGLV